MSSISASIPQCSAVSGCPKIIDIIIESPNGFRRGAHKDSLYLFNPGFPRPGSDTPRIQDVDVIKIEEYGLVAYLLLEFSHHQQCYPEMFGAGVDALVELADTAKKYGNMFALTACKLAMNHCARSSPENAIRLIRYIFNEGQTNPEADALVQSTMVLPMEIVGSHLGIGTLFMIYTIYRDKWKTAMEEYHRVIDDCPYLRTSLAKDATGKAAIYIQGALREDVAPSLMAVDTASRNAKGRYPKSRCGKLSPWIGDIRARIENLPTWETVRMDTINGTRSA
ncbi:hypothetical protein Moror_5521 [Moniliophthora roreri MCA 2997]|uniref:BTB domain-containing protein n=1 Tax=Moniliophthora roreri (strain MCA 2997) TaxID=1381753 RepID=V2Y962_MONRO|nr:hypothetical protein Moror_5521 [Moniliophthora roreri MCA 2997]KAI3618286.1 hypothetical protein WG66_005524 [Moniliophthora roreri]